MGLASRARPEQSEDEMKTYILPCPVCGKLTETDAEFLSGVSTMPCPNAHTVKEVREAIGIKLGDVGGDWIVQGATRLHKAGQNKEGISIAKS